MPLNQATLAKYLKNCDFVFTEIKTFVNKNTRGDRGMNNYYHRSVAGGVLTLLFIFMMLGYFVVLVFKMLSGVDTIYKL